MGRLLDGQWMTQDLGTDAQGRYVRQATQFRRTDVVAESGRYVLIVAYACGWSHRVLLVRALQGLQEAIPIVVADAFMGENGWTFGEDGIDINALYEDKTKVSEEQPAVKALHQLYVLAQNDYTGRASVPVLWDRHTGTIVNNESSDIVKLFLNSPLADLAKTPTPSLLPKDDNDAIQAMIQANYGSVNNGVYRCGFSSSQKAYEEAATALFARLDELEELLGKQRYLTTTTGGSTSSITLADLCLFPTLYRFDQVYHTHFKCNKKHIYEYPNLWAWTREIYQMDGVKDTCNMKDIREHYYTSHESIHPRRYIPLGPDLEFDEPHGRDQMEFLA